MTAAAMARPLSIPLMAGAAATGRVVGRWAVAAAGRCAAAAGAAAPGAGAGAAAACDGMAIGAPAEGPPGGRVGNLMVGAAEGLGGRLMRTVSFLGCTFEASGGLGGTMPPGKLGLFSAIIIFQVRVGRSHCQTLIGKKKEAFTQISASTPSLLAARESWPRVVPGRDCLTVGDGAETLNWGTFWHTKC